MEENLNKLWKENCLYNTWNCEKIKGIERKWTKMPATYAHYIFGKKVYKALPQDIKEIINENRPAYLLGLHGPDLVFYYRSFGKNRVNQLGVQMHKEPAAKFFEKARKQYQKRPNYVLLSYLCGFLCHFMLDSECHPYISSYMEEYDLGHLEIETDFERALMERDGLDPTTQNCTRHLLRDLDTEEAIASVFDGLEVYHIDDSIRGFQFCIRALQCPTKVKAVLLKGFFKLIGQEKTLGGLVMDGVENPSCEESREFLAERLERAVAPAVQEICSYVYKLDTDEALSERLNRDFE
jgi:hypothetical protein